MTFKHYKKLNVILDLGAIIIIFWETRPSIPVLVGAIIIIFWGIRPSIPVLACAIKLYFGVLDLGPVLAGAIIIVFC